MNLTNYVSIKKKLITYRLLLLQLVANVQSVNIAVFQLNSKIVCTAPCVHAGISSTHLTACASDYCLAIHRKQCTFNIIMICIFVSKPLSISTSSTDWPFIPEHASLNQSGISVLPKTGAPPSLM